MVISSPDLSINRTVYALSLVMSFASFDRKKGELRTWMQWVPYLKIWHLALNFLWSKHNTILLTTIYQYHSFCLYLVWNKKAKKENKIETLHLILPEFFSLPYVCIFLNNRLFPHSKNIHFQNETKCKASLVKRSLICMRIKKHFHINSFTNSLTLSWNKGLEQLGNGLFNNLGKV